MDWRRTSAARRLLASERGAVIRDWGGRVPVVLAYPNSYAVGMSSLAVHALYGLFNGIPGLTCERTFARLGRDDDRDEALFTLESQRPVRDAAVLAFSVSYEMDYFAVVRMLRGVPMPTRAAERREGDPIVLMGGPAISANPEPMAPLADVLFIGEVEPALADLGRILGHAVDYDRAGLIEALADVPGVYVPARPSRPVQRQWLTDLDAYPTHTTVVAPHAQFGDMFLMEIARGCPHRCRFCLANVIYRPHRERSLEGLLTQAREGLSAFRKVGLVGAAVSDYGEIEALTTGLRSMGAAISVSSLRIRPLPSVLVAALADSGARSITLAPEAGSQRLLSEIHKGITLDDVLRAVDTVRDRFASLKLYFMIGLPTESDADVEALVRLVGDVAARFTREVIVNITPFVPKPQTPYERKAMTPRSVLEARLQRIRTGCRALGPGRILVRAESVDDTLVQAMLARGDRRTGEVLAAMETPVAGRLVPGLREAGIDPASLLGSIDDAASLPWESVRAGAATA